MATEDEWVDVAPTTSDEWVDVQVTPQLKPSTLQTLLEREEFGKRLQSESQKPASQQATEGITNLIKGLWSPVAATGRAIGPALNLAGQPERIIPTGLEAARRAEFDIAGLIANAGRQLPNVAARGPLGALFQSIQPKTLTEEEIQTAFEAEPLKQAIQEARTTVPTNLPLGLDAPFQGAQPEVAEATAQVGPLLLPIKGLKSLKGTKATTDLGRNIRSAVKPPNAQLGSRIEKAANEEMGEIFNQNINADKMGAMPIEGFTKSVTEARELVGQRISEIRKRSGEKFDAGDQIAKELEAKADSLERAGQPKASIEFLREKATEQRGRLTELDDLQNSVTIANQQMTPFWSKSRAAQDPIRASVELTANKIIAEKGGSIINNSLEKIGGPEAATLRKKWGNLITIEKQAAERVNKMINQAPAEVQPVLTTALTSMQGAAGLFALVNGYAGGIIPVASSAIKAWSKKAAKELSDSNSLITRTYENLRNNPPPGTPLPRQLPPQLPPAIPSQVPPVAPPVAAPVVAPIASPQFSPGTIAALRKFGVKPGEPLWETLGASLERGSTGFPDAAGTSSIPYRTP